MRLLPSASSSAMTVWPQRPKITSTPRRSRYSVIRYAAIRVSTFCSIRSIVVGTTVLMTVLLLATCVRLEGLAVVELAEQLLLRWPVFGDGPAHPRDVHVVLERDVLVGDVAAPDAAAHARRHRHAVGEGAGVGARLHLPDHDAAHRRGQREAMDV